MVGFYQIRSTLSQVTDGDISAYIGAVSKAMGEELKRVSLEEYLKEDIALLYVASGGSEGFFLEIF